MEPLSNRPNISIKDIVNGYVMRYFVKNTSTNKVTEIDNIQYSKFKANPDYQVIEIKWTITGIKENITSTDGKVLYGVSHQNDALIQFYEKKMPGIKYMLRDTLEYYKGIGFST